MNPSKKTVPYLAISPLFSDSFQSFYIPMQKDPLKTQPWKKFKKHRSDGGIPLLTDGFLFVASG